MATKVVDPIKSLPEELIVQSVDNQLYRFGLCLTDYGSEGSSQERTSFHHPSLILLLLFVELIKCIINLIIADDILILYNGDFSRLFGIRVQFNTALLLFILMDLAIVFIWRHVHNRGIKARFLSLFQMMSGSLAPYRLGLTDSKSIIRLTKRATNLVAFVSFSNKQVMPIITFSLTFVPSLLTGTPLQAILFGIPNAVPLMLLGKVVPVWEFPKMTSREFPRISRFFGKTREGNEKSHIENLAPKL